MSIEEFIKKIEGEIEDLPAGILTPDKPFREAYEWSSMHSLIIIALIDTEYNVTITGDDLRKCVTPRDIYNIVQARM